MTRTQATTLIIARHGEAHCNRDQTIGGPRSCRGLTDHGQLQVHRLATMLHDQYPHLHAIYASPLRRAADSAAILGTDLGMPVTVEEDLREQDHGQADGSTWAVTVAVFGSVPALEADRPLAPGGETWREYLRRATAALTHILDRHQGERILVVGHGETADAAFHLFLRLPATSRAHAGLVLHPAAVSVWEQAPLAKTQPSEAWRWTLVTHNPAI
jgi:2,3-bisphosphoglycerate-dependent phosphoglycerate mutase